MLAALHCKRLASPHAHDWATTAGTGRERSHGVWNGRIRNGSTPVPAFGPTSMCAVSALSDVARLAGVSKATASRALSGRGYVSGTTRDRVVAAAAEIGYVVSSNAASLVTGQTRNVGVVIPHINRWYFGEVLEGIESGAHRGRATTSRLPAQRRRDRPPPRLRVLPGAQARGCRDRRRHRVHAARGGLLHSLRVPVVGLGGPDGWHHDDQHRRRRARRDWRPSTSSASGTGRSCTSAPTRAKRWTSTPTTSATSASSRR